MKKIINFIAVILFTLTSQAQQAGSLDTSFNPSNYIDAFVGNVTLRPDGKVNVVNYSGNLCLLNILNADGSIYGSYGGSYQFKTQVVQPDGKILVGGNFTNLAGTTRIRIARLNTDGSIDTSFNPWSGANNTVNKIILQPDGKIVILGAFTTYSGVPRNGIARLNADGSLDYTFEVGVLYEFEDRIIFNAVLLNNGKFLVGQRIQGSQTNQGLATCTLSLLNSNGSNDTSFALGIPKFGYGTSSVEFSAVLQPDGRIIIGGTFYQYNSTLRGGIIRLNANGSIDNTFDQGQGTGWVHTIALQTDGKIFIGGNFSSYNGTSRNNIARLNANGLLDITFNPGTGVSINPALNIAASVHTSALQPDGKIIIGGSFSSYNGIVRNYIARINGDQSLDTPNFYNNEIIIYPNPTKDILNFSLPETNTATAYEIYNLLGEKVSYGVLNSNSISVSNLANGIYIVKLNTSEGVLTEKFIKE